MLDAKSCLRRGRSDMHLDPEQQRYVASIRQSARSLLTLVNELLDSAKMEAGRLTLEVRSFDRHLGPHRASGEIHSAPQKPTSDPGSQTERSEV